MFVVIPDAPHNARFFTPRERVVIASRKRGDHTGGDSRRFKWDQALEAIMDPKLYLFFLFGFSASLLRPVVVLSRDADRGCSGEHPERRHVELRHAHCQGLRLRHAPDDAHADPVWDHHRCHHLRVRVLEQDRAPELAHPSHGARHPPDRGWFRECVAFNYPRSVSLADSVRLQ